ncbi:MAG TPA: PQQ-binding-like beta-propeller repeat protein [Vicinamibacterales bacterium]|nr:PQQ-binding-like beta-propeller repeat protein [Vicinamibacterales bacterium]
MGRYFLVAVTLGIVSLLHADTPRPGIDWPTFRGPGASGVAEGTPTPTAWDVPAGKNVRWRVPVAGLAHSSPIIWGNQVCTSSAVSGTPSPELKVGLYGDITSVIDTTVHRWLVACYDKGTGRQLWEQTAHSGVPKVKRHTKSTHASSTLATDGRFIVAFFGSEGLYAYDMKGREVWKKDFGLLDSGFFMVPEAQWGFASSPIIHGDRVIIQVDVQKGSFVGALDLKTGRELWRTVRNDVPTWSTPAVHDADGRAQVVVNGWKHIGGYDLATGKELWRMTGGGDIPVPTPIAAHGLIFITNAHGKMAPIFAVRPSATGDISLKEGETSNAHVAWSFPRDGGYMQTPIVYGDLLYVCRDNGVLSVFDAKTGQRHYQTRLADGRTGFSASPVASNGRIYYTSEEGDVYVIKAGTTFEQIAVNPLGEVAMATPAISEGMMFFRTRGHLVAVK